MREGLEKLLASGQDNALLRFGLGNAFFREENYAAAAEHLGRAVEHNPQYSAAWKLLGKAHAALNDDAAARAAFTQALASAEAKGDAADPRCAGLRVGPGQGGMAGLGQQAQGQRAGFRVGGLYLWPVADIGLGGRSAAHVVLAAAASQQPQQQ